MLERGRDAATTQDVETETGSEIESARWAEVVASPDEVDAQFSELVLRAAGVAGRDRMIPTIDGEDAALSIR